MAIGMLGNNAQVRLYVKNTSQASLPTSPHTTYHMAMCSD